MSPSPIPPLEDDDPSAAVSYFTLEERRRSGETKLCGEKLPVLPATHWSNDPCGPEPLINREDDGDVMGTPIDQLP